MVTHINVKKTDSSNGCAKDHRGDWFMNRIIQMSRHDLMESDMVSVAMSKASNSLGLLASPMRYTLLNKPG